MVPEGQVGLEAGLMLEVGQAEKGRCFFGGRTELVRSIGVASDTLGTGQPPQSDGRGRVEWRGGVREITSDGVFGCRTGGVRLTGGEGAWSRAKRCALEAGVRSGRYLRSRSPETITEVGHGLTSKSAGVSGHGCCLFRTVRLVDALRVGKKVRIHLMLVTREHGDVEGLGCSATDVGRGRGHLHAELVLTVAESEQRIVLLRMECSVVCVEVKLGMARCVGCSQSQAR